MNSLRSLLLALMASLALAGNTTSNSTDDSSSSSDNITITNNNPSSSSSSDDNSTTTTTTTTTAAGNTTTTTTTTTAAGNTTTTTTTTTAAAVETTTTTVAVVVVNDTNETTAAGAVEMQAGITLAAELPVPDNVKNICTNYLGMTQILTFASKLYFADKTTASGAQVSMTQHINSGFIPNCADDKTLPGTSQCLLHEYTDSLNLHTANFEPWKISRGYDAVKAGCDGSDISARRLSSKRRLTTTTLNRGDSVAVVYAQSGATVPGFAQTIKSQINAIGTDTAAIGTELTAKVAEVTTKFANNDVTGIPIPKTKTTAGASQTNNLAAIVTGSTDPTTSVGTLPAAASNFTATVTVSVNAITELEGAAVPPGGTTSGSVSNGVATAVLAAVAGATMVMAF